VELVEQISENVVTIPAEWSVTDAYGKLDGKAFYIEPLNARQPLADFLLGGGLGWGSLRHGSFASKLYKVQTDKFTFGSNYSTSVNAGYPLHRLVEGMPHQLCPLPDAKIERVTVPLRAKPAVKAVFRACALTDAVVPSPAANFLWVNDAAASALGVPGAGSIAFFEAGSTRRQDKDSSRPGKTKVSGEISPNSANPGSGFEPEGEGEPVEGVYEKRFFEDAVPPGFSMLKVLTVKSNLPKLKELAGQSARFFICLWTHLGVLVCISGKPDALVGIEREAVKRPLTFSLPKKGGGPRQFTAAVQEPQEPAAEKPEKPAPAAPKPAPPKEEKPADGEEKSEQE
jgi:hypothetical protein